MGFDAQRAVVVAGDGVVARYPGVLCVARCPDPRPLRQLLALCEQVAGEIPGRALARRLAAWLVGPDAPGDTLEFGTIAEAGERLAVFLSGSVDVAVMGSGMTLSGADAAAWTDRLIPRPESPVLLALDRAAPSAEHLDGVLDLRAGVVPGAGVVLEGVAGGVAAPVHVPEPAPAYEPIVPVEPVPQPPPVDEWSGDPSGHAANGMVEGFSAGEWFSPAAAAEEPSDDPGLPPAPAWGETPVPPETPEREEPPPWSAADPWRSAGPAPEWPPLNGLAPEPPLNGLSRGPSWEQKPAPWEQKPAEEPRAADPEPVAEQPEPAASPDPPQPKADERPPWGAVPEQGPPNGVPHGAPRWPGYPMEAPRPLNGLPRNGPRLEPPRAPMNGLASHGMHPEGHRPQGQPDGKADAGGTGRHAQVDVVGETPEESPPPAAEAPEREPDVDARNVDVPSQADEQASAADPSAGGVALNESAPANESAPVDDDATADDRAPADYDAPSKDAPTSKERVPPKESPSPQDAASAMDASSKSASSKDAAPAVQNGQAADPGADEPTPHVPRPPVSVPRAPRRSEQILGVAPEGPKRRPLEIGAPVGAPPGRPASANGMPHDEPQARGHLCSRGHLNDPRSHFCVLCGIRMNERTGVLVVGARPPLGLLVLDDGATYTVDAEYLVGRMPEADQRVQSGMLRAIVVEDRSGAVSRVHAEIRVNGWDVLLSDSGSRNGTFVAGPADSGWAPLPPGRSRRLVPGTRIRMGGRTFVFESPSGVR